MSNLSDFRHSRILRHPATWIVAALGGTYGGLHMYGIREAKRAGDVDRLVASLWLERSIDFLFGATIQIVLLLCAVWLLAGLMENTNAWIRQITVVAVYLGINWLSQFL